MREWGSPGKYVKTEGLPVAGTSEDRRLVLPPLVSARRWLECRPEWRPSHLVESRGLG
jgi:hypothetical protein